MLRTLLGAGSLLTLLACSPPPPQATDAGMEGGVVVGVPMDDAGNPNPDPTDSGVNPDSGHVPQQPDSGHHGGCNGGDDDDDDDHDHHHHH